MLITQCEQGSDEWLNLRVNKFTGSRFAALMNRLKNGKPGSEYNELITEITVERLTGCGITPFINAAMKRGTELEPFGRAAYAEKTWSDVTECGFVHHNTLSYVGISPDGLVGDDGLVEIKCPASQSKHLAALLEGAHALEYHWQVQGQMWVTGRKWCDVVSYDPRWPEHLTLAITRVPYDPACGEALFSACIEANDLVELNIQKITATLASPVKDTK